MMTYSLNTSAAAVAAGLDRQRSGPGQYPYQAPSQATSGVLQTSTPTLPPVPDSAQTETRTLATQTVR